MAVLLLPFDVVPSSLNQWRDSGAIRFPANIHNFSVVMFAPQLLYSRPDFKAFLVYETSADGGRNWTKVEPTEYRGDATQLAPKCVEPDLAVGLLPTDMGLNFSIDPRDGAALGRDSAPQFAGQLIRASAIVISGSGSGADYGVVIHGTDFDANPVEWDTSTRTG
jgi:hypothetical protein